LISRKVGEVLVDVGGNNISSSLVEIVLFSSTDGVSLVSVFTEGGGLAVAVFEVLE